MNINRPPSLIWTTCTPEKHSSRTVSKESDKLQTSNCPLSFAAGKMCSMKLPENTSRPLRVAERRNFRQQASLYLHRAYRNLRCRTQFVAQNWGLPPDLQERMCGRYRAKRCLQIWHFLFSMFMHSQENTTPVQQKTQYTECKLHINAKVFHDSPKFSTSVKIEFFHA